MTSHFLECTFNSNHLGELVLQMWIAFQKLSISHLGPISMYLGLSSMENLYHGTKRKPPNMSNIAPYINTRQKRANVIQKSLSTLVDLQHKFAIFDGYGQLTLVLL